MKKLNFILLLLLSFMGVMQTYAQNVGDEVEIQVQYSNGKWVEWNKNEASPWARSWYSNTIPAISVCCKRGAMETTDVRGNKFNGANNMSYWGDDQNNLMFFSRYGSNDAIYEITVAKGWYIKSVNFDFNCANNKNEQDGSITVRLEDLDDVTSAAPDDDQHVKWENDDESIYSAEFTVVRKSGTYNFARISNLVVVASYLGAQSVAAYDVQTIYEKYYEYLKTGAIILGTQPGQYDKTAFETFKELMYSWDGINDYEEYMDMEVDEITAIGENIETAFKALMASRVPITLANGYYRIRSVHSFSSPKYMSAKMGSTINAIYSTPDNLDSFSPAIWKVEMRDDLFDIMNVAYDVRFTAAKPVTLTAESDSLIALDPVNTENGVTRVNIRLAAKEADAYNYFYCAGYASSQTNNITLWSNSDPASASEWVFEPVSASDVDAAIKAYASIKERELMLIAYDTLMTAAKRELANVINQKNINMTVNTAKNLITDAEQFSSPYSDSSEGTDFGALLDGNTSTYWHSNWHNGNKPNHTHYLQVALVEAVEGDIAMTFTRHSVTNDHITEWTVLGSNDADAEDWQYLTYISTPYSNNRETLTSLPFDTKGYTNLRFYIDGTTTGRGYGHMSEFQLNPASLNAEQAVTYLNEAVALNNIVGIQSLMERDSINQANFDSLKTAYDLFVKCKNLYKAVLAVEDILVKAGDSFNVGIDLINYNTDLVGFQMDLTLPEGVSLDKTGCSLSSRITDGTQSLTIGKIGENVYRITSASFSLKPISGTSGTLLTLKLMAEDGSVGGQSTISNICFSTSNSERVSINDVMFSVRTMYELTYQVDGEVVKTDTLVYDSTITPLAEPTKEGYTFSGWSEIPARMPANDVEVTGTFTINTYVVTYKVDGEIYKTDNVTYNSAITPEKDPTKEGYTFSGWSEIPETMPAQDIEVVGSFSVNTYAVTYKVDGEVYKTDSVTYNAAITPEAEPTKEGYTFGGWSEVPETMPAHDIEVTGAFTVNNYTLTYKVDGEEYKTSTIAYGTELVLEADPTKEGYTFGGWSELPETMPASDVVITGSFYLYGDVNTDEFVDIVDVVDIARFVVATPSDNFREKLADLNYDKTVNIGDAVTLVNYIVGDQNFVKPMRASRLNSASDALTMTQDGESLFLNLTNSMAYTAFQFDLYVSEDETVERMMLSVQRNQKHQLLYNKVEDGHYRVAAFSTSNRTFQGNEGELLSFVLNGTSFDDVTVCNIHFFDTEGNEYLFDDIRISRTDGIGSIENGKLKMGNAVVYDLQGRRHTKKQRGVNIINGKKFYVK